MHLIILVPQEVPNIPISSVMPDVPEEPTDVRVSVSLVAQDGPSVSSGELTPVLCRRNLLCQDLVQHYYLTETLKHTTSQKD